MKTNERSMAVFDWTSLDGVKAEWQTAAMEPDHNLVITLSGWLKAGGGHLDLSKASLQTIVNWPTGEGSPLNEDWLLYWGNQWTLPSEEACLMAKQSMNCLREKKADAGLVGVLQEAILLSTSSLLIKKKHYIEQIRGFITEWLQQRAAVHLLSEATDYRLLLGILSPGI